MISENSKRTIEKLDSGNYLNSKEIEMGGVGFTAREVLIKVPLISRLNIYYLSSTGRAKSQLGNDLVGYFGDAACYVMGRPDFDPSELLKQVRLGKIDEVETDSELIELTSNVRKNLWYVDELNRAPPIIQNYFFDFAEGRIVFNGKNIPLGTDGYSILAASGNLGNGEYVGVSESDRALLDRMHMIVKLDYPCYHPKPIDMFDVYRRKTNPRANMNIEDLAISEDIIALSNEFMDRDVHPIWPLMGVYFTEGLDYLENVEGHSKLACDSRWPHLKGIRKDSDESTIMTMSPRSVFSAMGIAGALEMIAETKGKEVNKLELFVDSLRLSVPFSGVLSNDYVEKYSGDVYKAFDAILMGMKNDILVNSEKLEEALAFAEAGKRNDTLLNEISDKEGKWKPIRETLEDYADRVAKNPTEKSKKLGEIIDKAFSN